MKSLNHRTFALAFISSLAVVFALQAAAQESTTTAQPVKVVNTAKNPVPTVVEPDTTQYQFQSVIGYPCEPVNQVPTDFCTASGATVESVLDTYSSEGYEVLAVSPLSVGVNGIPGFMVYTLRAPVKGAHRKGSSAH